MNPLAAPLGSTSRRPARCLALRLTSSGPGEEHRSIMMSYLCPAAPRPCGCHRVAGRGGRVSPPGPRIPRPSTASATSTRRPWTPTRTWISTSRGSFSCKALELCASEASTGTRSRRRPTSTWCGAGGGSAARRRHPPVSARAGDRPQHQGAKRLGNPEIQGLSTPPSEGGPEASPPVATAPPYHHRAACLQASLRRTPAFRRRVHAPSPRETRRGHSGQRDASRAACASSGWCRLIAPGASDFLARDMEREASGEYQARIPEPATAGGSVAYYIEAAGARRPGAGAATGRPTSRTS
jgi:hypothetical protein